MAFDEGLAARVRAALDAAGAEASEKKMFGGLAFMLRGHMCCGIVEEELMLRLGPELAPQALKKPHTREMDFTGKPMKSMLYVEPAGVRADEDLAAWVAEAVGFNATLPAK